MKDNFFIVIEGIDSSGKSTLIELLKKKLAENTAIKEYFGSKIVFTSEPYGPEIREIKYAELSKPLFSANYNLWPTTSALLFLAIRSEHLNSFILPKIRENFLIICDRFYPSTLAYQVYLQRLDLDWIKANMHYLMDDLAPRLTFLLEVSRENHTHFHLKKRENRKCNKYDSDPSLFYTNLVKAYEWSFSELRKEKQKIVIIPDKFNWEQKTAMVIEHIQALIIS